MFRCYKISGTISTLCLRSSSRRENIVKTNNEILSEYLANRHPCRHFRRHAVIASCIYAYYIRCDKTWLLECLVHCSASAGVDWVIRSFDCNSPDFRNCLICRCFSLPKMKIIFWIFYLTHLSLSFFSTCNTWHSSNALTHDIFLIYDELPCFLSRVPSFLATKGVPRSRTPKRTLDCIAD